MRGRQTLTNPALIDPNLIDPALIDVAITAPPSGSDVNSYFRPDGSSRILRPDGTSQYIRP